jgi:hypothetical protein
MKMNRKKGQRTPKRSNWLEKIFQALVGVPGDANTASRSGG